MSLSTVKFKYDHIKIGIFEPNKTQGHDTISIQMFISKPLTVIVNLCLEEGKFHHEWKKATLVPAINYKQDLKNYLLVPLLSVSGKVIERLLHNSIFKFFSKNDLMLHKQPGFKTGTRYLLASISYSLVLQIFC